MLGHSSRDVVDIVRAAGLNAGFFWLHDMGSLCAGIHLLRNDVEELRRAAGRQPGLRDLHLMGLRAPSTCASTNACSKGWT